MNVPKLFLASLAAATLALAFDGDNFSAKFEALPQAVKDTAKANMDNAFPVSIASAQSAQGWNYQVNTRRDGKYHDIVIDEKGKLIAVKDETDLAALPAPAQQAIRKQAAVSKILTLEKVTEGSHISYGAVIRDESSGSFVKLSVAPDGTVQSKN
ncbi:MAG: hypothetical protein KGN84_22790 [Acidobacteriota bacterium]|nr:hypothetical protein [Acidobacteriota bacterium]